MIFNVVLGFLGVFGAGGALLWFLNRRRFYADIEALKVQITKTAAEKSLTEANAAEVITRTSTGLLGTINAQLTE